MNALGCCLRPRLRQIQGDSHLTARYSACSWKFQGAGCLSGLQSKPSPCQRFTRSVSQFGGFPKTIIRAIVFWSLYWGPPILGNYHLFLPTELLDAAIQLGGIEGKHFLQPGRVTRSLEVTACAALLQHLVARFLLPEGEATLFMTDPSTGICLLRAQRFWLLTYSC